MVKTCCCCFLFLTVVAAAIAIAAVTVKKKPQTLATSPVPGPPGAIDAKYANALEISLRFFQVQKSGKLVGNKIAWRGDSALDDGKEAGLDLSKGMYDAGDHIKFGFPMAFTATVLSWAILEYGDQMEKVKQLDPAHDALKWITDYLINAHPSKNVLYIQVGDPEVDHACWERPETMTDKRPLLKIDEKTPGSDVAAETAAAMAAASLVFKTKDPNYSEVLLKHAEDLFSFADNNRGSYTTGYPKIQKYYNSTAYIDELLWAASWLYHASGDDSYLGYVTGDNGATFANWGNPSWFSWDNKHPGTQVLLSRVNMFDQKKEDSKELQLYRKTAEAVMCTLLLDSPTSTSSRTDGGLIWVSEWNSLMHPVGAAFLAVLYSDYMLTSQTPSFSCDSSNFTPKDLRQFAMSQADYILGANAMNLSYLIGYGTSYPQQVHHRGASIPANAKTGCKGFQWLQSPEANPNIAMGALVGGPFKNDSYIDSRNNSMQGEPTTYNSALLVGLLSGLTTISSVPLSFN